MTVLWLKIGQLAYMESIKGFRPLLLLDDIFSELDSHHDELVFDLISQQQTIIATTDLHPRFKQDNINIKAVVATSAFNTLGVCVTQIPRLTACAVSIAS